MAEGKIDTLADQVVGLYEWWAEEKLWRGYALVVVCLAGYQVLFHIVPTVWGWVK